MTAPRTLIVLAAALMAAGAWAKPSGSLSAQDRDFVAKAAQGGAGEVALGHLAAQLGAHRPVKRFGRQMVTDHRHANARLGRIADSLGLRPQMTPGPQEQADYAKLSRLRGAAFDQAYAKHMVMDHRNDIADFEKEARQGSNPAIRRFAATTLPTLRMHLRMAESLPAGHRGHRM